MYIAQEQSLPNARKFADLPSLTHLSLEGLSHTPRHLPGPPSALQCRLIDCSALSWLDLSLNSPPPS